jgi:hypothetical protein
MSGEIIRIDLISQPQVEAEEARSKSEKRQKTRRANVSCDHTNSRRDGRRRLL